MSTGSLFDMEWISDVSAGYWLRERLSDDWSIHHVVPRGFEAYARIFHPPQVRSLPDRPVPEMDEWVRMPEAEQNRLMELFTDEETTWSATAATFGTALHPLAQWARVVRTPIDADWNTRIAPDGREFTSPDEGRMPASTLAAIAAVLAQHTATPDDGFVGVWEGWGGLVGAYGSNGRGFFEITDDPPRELGWSSLRANFENPFRKAKWQPGILSDEISRGPRFELPDRDHVLFSAAPAAFADPNWVLDAPWRDRPAEDRGFAPEAQHPSILWPADRAWVMVSEIDYDSTIVAGSAALIQAICADAALEALPLREGADLSWDADTIN